MSYHAVEIAEDQDGPCLVCVCGEESHGSTWEEAGRSIDNHINEAAIAKDGER